MLALPADHAGDLAAAFAALWRHEALPPLMQAGVMDAAGVLRHHVLVHDASAMGPDVLAAAQGRLQAAAATLGSGGCQVLRINSGSGGGPPVAPRLWSDMLHPCLPGGGAGEPAERLPTPAGGLGAWLSEGDASGLSGFVHELAVRGVIPHLEARLRALNAQVGGCARPCRRAQRVRPEPRRRGSGPSWRHAAAPYCSCHRLPRTLRPTGCR